MEEIEKKMEEHLLIGGDFNARTEDEGGPIRIGRKEEEEKRRSRDKKIKGGKNNVKQVKRKGMDDTEWKL